MSNLLDNARHHNHSGGNVQVLVDTQAGQASLKVTNTGPVVPPEQLNRLLQPFQRLVADRAGHHDRLGLGLSIVQAITTAHGAHLALHPGNAGGLDIEVRFPAAIAASSGNRTAVAINQSVKAGKVGSGSR